MKSSDTNSPGSELKLFLALTRAEPEWREVTVDHCDVRLGGFVVGGETGETEDLVCMNLHPAAEVALPLDALHAERVCAPPPWLSLLLGEVRRVRAAMAADYVSRLRRAPETAGPVEQEAVDWTDELALARDTDEEKSAGAALFSQLLRHLVDPRLTRVVRSVSTGGMWAFGVEGSGDVVVGSHDVEARRSGEAPTFLWIPDEGGLALQSFLTSSMEATSPDDDDATREERSCG